MQHPVSSRYPLHDLLHNRWSPLAFSEEPIPSEVLVRLFKAARWAPSSYNGQPWRFLIARRTEPAEFQKLASCLVEANRVWAAHAPVLVLSIAALNFEHNGKPNAHAWYDVGQAVAHLSVQAMALGLFVHQMAGFDSQRARELYAIPADYAPASMFAIGRHGRLEDLPESYRARETAPRQRKELNALVFGERFGQAARDLA